MAEVVVYATERRAATARALLNAACRATGTSARLEFYGSGSLYQRLGPRHGPPAPDVVMWFGCFWAQAAADDGLLQSYQPAAVPSASPHDQDWKWTTLDYSVIGAVGSPALATWNDVAAVPHLAFSDPERSEVGLSILLASLDRARQTEGDAERGWTWWQNRARAGLLLAEDDDGTAAMLEDSRASHALRLGQSVRPLLGLPPLPNAVSLTAASRNVDGARRLLDWLTSEAGSTFVAFSAWQPAGTSVSALLQAAPALDVEWARQQYTATRRRWAQSGFGPSLDS